VPWIAIDIGLAVAGLAVLGGLAVRLYRQVRVLAGEVASAADRLGAELTDLPERLPPEVIDTHARPGRGVSSGGRVHPEGMS